MLPKTLVICDSEEGVDLFYKLHGYASQSKLSTREALIQEESIYLHCGLT